MPPYQTLFDGANMAQFWGYVKYILFYIAPAIMIIFAIDLVGRVVGVAKNTVSSEDEPRRRRDYHDDDDYY